MSELILKHLVGSLSVSSRWALGISIATTGLGIFQPLADGGDLTVFAKFCIFASIITFIYGVIDAFFTYHSRIMDAVAETNTQTREVVARANAEILELVDKANTEIEVVHKCNVTIKENIEALVLRQQFADLFGERWLVRYLEVFRNVANELKNKRLHHHHFYIRTLVEQATAPATDVLRKGSRDSYKKERDEERRARLTSAIDDAQQSLFAATIDTGNYIREFWDSPNGEYMKAWRRAANRGVDCVYRIFVLRQSLFDCEPRDEDEKELLSLLGAVMKSHGEFESQKAQTRVVSIGSIDARAIASGSSFLLSDDHFLAESYWQDEQGEWHDSEVFVGTGGHLVPFVDRWEAMWAEESYLSPQEYLQIMEKRRKSGGRSNKRKLS